MTENQSRIPHGDGQNIIPSYTVYEKAVSLDDRRNNHSHSSHKLISSLSGTAKSVTVSSTSFLLSTVTKGIKGTRNSILGLFNGYSQPKLQYTNSMESIQQNSDISINSHTSKNKSQVLKNTRNIDVNNDSKSISNGSKESENYSNNDSYSQGIFLINLL